MRQFFGRWPSFEQTYDDFRSPPLWIAWALISVAVAFAGPFGTFYSQTFVWRLFYWGGLIAVAVLIGMFCKMFWNKVLLGRSELVEDFAVGMSVSVICGPFVCKLNGLLGWENAPLAMSAIPMTLSIFSISIGFFALRRVLRDEDNAPKQKLQNRDRLLSRIKTSSRARLRRISSDNHHICIFTDDGKEHRILMRLSDAVIEADIEPGFCVHRSHWVAQSSVVAVKKDAGREVVALSCGTELPVGPKYRDNLDFAPVVNA